MEDKEKIESLGGPAQLAKRLGYAKHGGVQRVHNWITRGIPYRVKVEFPELFLSHNLSHKKNRRGRPGKGDGVKSD